MAIHHAGGCAEVDKERRMCCCPAQPHITDSDLQRLVKDPSIQMRNLSESCPSGLSSYEIRENFQESNIPFRYEGCPRGMLACCGSCTRMCAHRCPQDVMCRAYLFCGNIMGATDPEERKRRYDAESTEVQLLYEELTSDDPHYFVIASMITAMCSPVCNKKLDKIIREQYGSVDSPHRLDYAPMIEYEEVQKVLPNGEIEYKSRKKVDPVTGEVAVLKWPLSGICPFCLPYGLVDRRRKTGKRNAKYV